MHLIISWWPYMNEKDESRRKPGCDSLEEDFCGRQEDAGRKAIFIQIWLSANFMHVYLMRFQAHQLFQHSNIAHGHVPIYESNSKNQIKQKFKIAANTDSFCSANGILQLISIIKHVASCFLWSLPSNI